MGLKWCDVCCRRRCWRRRWRRRTILPPVKIHTRERVTRLHFTACTVSPAWLLWDYSLHNLSSLSVNLLWARVPAGNTHMLYFPITAVANNNFHRYSHMQSWASLINDYQKLKMRNMGAKIPQAKAHLLAHSQPLRRRMWKSCNWLLSVPTF